MKELFVSSLEIDGLNPEDYNTQTLESLAEVMHDYYQTYIIDTKKEENDILSCYKNSFNFVKEVYLTLNKGEKS